ncbi:hypothetical protein C4544_02235 [candidate division WS5 bacterium]|uniref:Uncharacterized protein n=1 Tax=candidate division WS5 bacterium TaxID=2093353 RepID=A0A419DEU8_9BACT|nr:MAG: hypothetical protein C4544_02235 [candidate division WS5 bacterium]
MKMSVIRAILVANMVITLLLTLPMLAGAAAVPWSSQSYSVWTRAYTAGDYDSSSGLLSASALVDSNCCSDGWEYGYGNANGSLLEVAASTQGAYAYSQAYAEFKGTYIASDPTILYSYDLTRNYSGAVVGNWGSILIQDMTASSTLYSWAGLLSDSDTITIPTTVGNEIYVNLSIEATATSGSLGVPEVNSAALSYTTAIAPEPISSILFITGGTLLAGRRFIRRKV